MAGLASRLSRMDGGEGLERWEPLRKRSDTGYARDFKRGQKVGRLILAILICSFEAKVAVLH